MTAVKVSTVFAAMPLIPSKRWVSIWIVIGMRETYELKIFLSTPNLQIALLGCLRLAGQKFEILRCNIKACSRMRLGT